MRIAIPTDDGQHICSFFRSSRGFVVATIRNSEVTRTELRWNLLSEMLTSESGSLYNLHDCTAVIIDEIDPCVSKRLEKRNLRIIRTQEKQINRAFSGYCDNLRKIKERKKIPSH